MSAPGADPLAAIRQRNAGMFNRASNTYDAVFAFNDRAELLDIWDNRESALRAIVAQWREAARVAEPENDGYSVAMDECADALERLLSGPQPTPTPEHQP